jgi:hypothetical protein
MNPNGRDLGRQAVLDVDGNAVFNGEWDPRALADLLTPGDAAWWGGRHVLDIGANTGGLSLELARMGASVTLAEPDPYGTSLALTRDLVTEFADREELDVHISDADLFSSHELGRHDTILCLGLLYHFRYPQLVLDYLSSLETDWLFVSSQTHPSDELALYNRASPGLLRRNHLRPDLILAGWHPTRALLERMLESAGFTDVTDLTDRRYDFPEKPKGATNSAYYSARLRTPVDPETLKRVFYGGGQAARHESEPRRPDLIP